MIFITQLCPFQGQKMSKKVFSVFPKVLLENRAVFKIVHGVELFNVWLYQSSAFVARVGAERRFCESYHAVSLVLDSA
jgi:hypothetical protein